MRTTFHKRLVFLILLGLLLFPALAGSGCAAGDSEKGQYKIHTEMVFLENGRGSYTLAEFAVPENYMPDEKGQPAAEEGQPAGAKGQPAGAKGQPAAEEGQPAGAEEGQPAGAEEGQPAGAEEG
ncbi:MAG: hypothetical protein ACI4SU_04250, partial [Anaerovoracaceae bacterium]